MARDPLTAPASRLSPSARAAAAQRRREEQGMIDAEYAAAAADDAATVIPPPRRMGRGYAPLGGPTLARATAAVLPAAMAAQDGEQTVAPPVPVERNNRAWPTAIPEDNPAGPADMRRAGLTRIVKTADGTYVQTNDPNVRGTERIYDALGNRADVNQSDVFTPGRQFSGTREVAQAEDSAAARADELATPEGRARVLERGRQGLARSGAMRAAATAQQQEAFLRTLDPKTRANLLTEQMKEDGQNARAAASLGVQRQGQRAALIQAQNAVAKTGIDVDQYERERLSNPETAAAAMQEFFNQYDDPAQAAQALRDDPRGRRVAAAAREGLRRQTGERDITPGRLERTSAFSRFFGAGPYTDSSSLLFGDYYDPSLDGLSDEDVAALRLADLQRNAR